MLFGNLTGVQAGAYDAGAPGVATAATDIGLAPPTWQNNYAYPDWRNRMARLAPDQEAQFQAWARTHNAPLTADYDMRGYWLHGGAGAAVNPNDHQLHYPDTYKTPLHQSFSGESMFANPRSNPPRWNNRDQLVLPNGTVVFDERARRR